MVVTGYLSKHACLPEGRPFPPCVWGIWTEARTNRKWIKTNKSFIIIDTLIFVLSSCCRVSPFNIIFSPQRSQLCGEWRTMRAVSFKLSAKPLFLRRRDCVVNPPMCGEGFQGIWLIKGLVQPGSFCCSVFSQAERRADDSCVSQFLFPPRPRSLLRLQILGANLTQSWRMICKHSH